MYEDKSKLKLIGEITQANNKNLELIQEINKLQDKLEEYENMRKEAIEYIKYNATSNYFDSEKNMFRREEDLLNILNKVGEDNE